MIVCRRRPRRFACFCQAVLLGLIAVTIVAGTARADDWATSWATTSAGQQTLDAYGVLTNTQKASAIYNTAAPVMPSPGGNPIYTYPDFSSTGTSASEFEANAAEALDEGMEAGRFLPALGVLGTVGLVATAVDIGWRFTRNGQSLWMHLLGDSGIRGGSSLVYCSPHLQAYYACGYGQRWTHKTAGSVFTNNVTVNANGWYLTYAGCTNDLRTGCSPTPNQTYWTASSQANQSYADMTAHVASTGGGTVAVIGTVSGQNVYGGYMPDTSMMQHLRSSFPVPYTGQTGSTQNTNTGTYTIPNDQGNDSDVAASDAWIAPDGVDWAHLTPQQKAAVTVLGLRGIPDFAPLLQVSLTDVEREQAISIMEGDSRFLEALDLRGYSITDVGPWTKTTGENIGAALTVTLTEPASIEFDWPVIDYDPTESTTPPYQETTVHGVASDVTELLVEVDLASGRMVSMMPLDGSLTTSELFRGTAAFSTAAESQLVVSTDGGGSTRFLQRHRVGEDSFWTFDFRTSDYNPATNFPVARNKVDWPVNLIFFNNADVDKAKSSIPTFHPAEAGEASSMWGRIDDERGTGDPRPPSNFFGSTWDHDRGAIRGAPCSIKYHYRVYAPSPELTPAGDDRMFNLSWSFYVIATSHEDVLEGCWGFSGNSEGAENRIARDAREWGLNVAEDSVFLGNFVDGRVQARSHFKSNGYATTIQIP